MPPYVKDCGAGTWTATRQRPGFAGPEVRTGFPTRTAVHAWLDRISPPVGGASMTIAEPAWQPTDRVSTKSGWSPTRLDEWW